MKITEVRAFLMSSPLPEVMRMPFWGGERTIVKRDAMLIRVKADNGLVGYAPGPAHERAAREIREIIRPFLLGADPLKWSQLKMHGDLEVLKTFHADEAAAIQAMGFSAYKMRPALGPDDDLKTVELMRRATGPDFGLMIDAHS